MDCNCCPSCSCGLKCCGNNSAVVKARVGEKAPDFTVDAVMPDGTFSTVTLSQFAGNSYVLLFFYPLDFTFVCPTEILAFNNALSELNEKKVKVLGCSVDSKFAHAAWRRTPVDSGGIGSIGFPLLADLNKSVATAFGVLNDDGVALRGLFIIDKNSVLQHALVNNLPLGRSVEEAIRIIDAVKYHEDHGEVCPANWKKGDKGMVASLKGVTEFLQSSTTK